MSKILIKHNKNEADVEIDLEKAVNLIKSKREENIIKDKYLKRCKKNADVFINAIFDYMIEEISKHTRTEEITKSKINEIKRIVRGHTEVILKIVTGDGKPSLSLLKKIGISIETTDLLTIAFKYGRFNIINNNNIGL